MNVQSLLNYPLLSLLIPYLFTIFVYYVLKFFRLHKWRKIHLTAQISALCYVAGVVILVEALFDLFLLGYILILFILFLSIHLIVQWKKKVDLSLKIALVLLLRITFLLFLCIYTGLAVLYIIRFFA